MTSPCELDVKLRYACELDAASSIRGRAAQAGGPASWAAQEVPVLALGPRQLAGRAGAGRAGRLEQLTRLAAISETACSPFRFESSHCAFYFILDYLFNLGD